MTHSQVLKSWPKKNLTKNKKNTFLVAFFRNTTLPLLLTTLSLLLTVVLINSQAVFGQIFAPALFFALLVWKKSCDAKMASMTLK